MESAWQVPRSIWSKAMNFEHDLFISYAHIDNQALVPGQDGWITTFQRSIEIRLAQLLGREPKIWRDLKLNGNDFFDEEIVQQLPKVAALITILSPRYVQSEWCLKELQAFCDATESSGGVRFGNKARIFKVVKTPVATEKHPPLVQGVLGYEFYRVSAESTRPRELAQGTEGENEYWAKLDDLAYDLCELIERVQSSSDQPSTNGNSSKRAIYVAETTHDLREKRDAIRRDLMLHGYPVFPDKPLPLVSPEFQQAVGESLAQCDMSIHLVGRNYGVVPEGDTKSIVELQNELARNAGDDDGQLPRLIWVPPGLEVDDERQQGLIDFLQTHIQKTNTDLLEVSLEEFKAAIHERLRRDEPDEDESKSDDATDAVPADDSEVRRIYLVCDQRDLENVGSLEDYLFDQGYEVVLPAFEGDEADVRQDHVENLRMCEGIIIYYGSANELWLRAKLRELQKVAGYGRAEPMLAKAIFIAGPSTPKKERFRTREAIILRATEGFSADVMTQFVEKLARRDRVS